MMGTWILIIAAVIELLFLIYRSVTRSLQENARSVVQIGEFAVFSLLALLSVIPWSFRWYGLGALLLIWAARGLWRLWNSKSQEGTYRTRTVVFRAITALLLVFAAVTPALIFPPYHLLAPTGSYQVGTTRYTYIDEGRIDPFRSSGENRRVNAAFWYPQNQRGEEIYPLVVFSHGGLGTEDSNESLYFELASHGYVVCSIGHPYHTIWTQGADGRVTYVDRAYFQELQREDAKRDKPQSFLYYQKWMETRTRDINLVIDTILNNTASSAGGVYRLIDVERIGVMGHSLGGSAALAMPRQRADIDAVIALESPYLYDIIGVEDGAFVFTPEAYPAPVLNIYSDSAWGHLAEWPQYARNQAMLSAPSATEFSLHLPGAGHFSLTDLSLASPGLVQFLEGGKSSVANIEYLQKVNQACPEFLNRYLKNRQAPL